MIKHILLPYDQHITTDKAEQGLIIERIVDTLPVNGRKKGLVLLQLLKPYLAWNQLGEILIDKTPIRHSHISDLIKFTVVRHFNKHKPPIGFDQFAQILEQHNIPQSLIVNKLPAITKSDWLTL